MQSRHNLPFRKNTEGYFTDNNENILARREQNYIIFPGGGFKQNESPEECIIRETLEETGAIVKDLKRLGKVRIIWGSDWATTDKQKTRYEKYQGDEMYLFTGQIKDFKKISQEEDSWKNKKLIKIKEVINLIKQVQNTDYRKKQLEILQRLAK